MVCTRHVLLKEINTYIGFDIVSLDRGVMTSVAKTGKEKKFWIYAFRDHLAGLQCFSNCIVVADIKGNGDYKLVIADGSRRLKVFGGTSLVSQLQLLSVPSSITVFYAEGGDDVQRPVIAVACGPYIFMYRDMKPLYRFTVPSVELDEVDVAVWEALRNDTISIPEAADMLEDRRRNGVELSTHSTDLLASDNAQERERIVESFKDKPISQPTLVTCMSSLPLEGTEEGCRSCLVFGTENRYIYVLKNSFTEIHLKIKIPGVPVSILIAGSLRIDYRIIVSSRDGCVYCIKNGKLSGSVIYPDGPIVQIARYDNLVAVATMQNTLSYFNLKGKRQSCVFLPLPITNIATITETATGKARGIIVALNNGTICVYVGKTLIHESKVYNTVTAMHFGRYGREDAALILVLQNGSLVVEMLHRHASFETEKINDAGPPPEQDVPIPVPSLTSVFVAQAERERTYGVDMHRSFQRDLCRLRLNTAKSYLSLLSKGVETTTLGSSKTISDNSIRMMTVVKGIGPVFKIQITLQNTSQKPMDNLVILLNCSPTFCKILKLFIDVPLLLPSVLSSHEVLVERLGDNEGDEGVHVCVTSPSVTSPLATATVELPDLDIIEDGM
ncbi:putative Bardet-Biedl syndrome 1 protein [Trypanosoma theileri]|uniref:Putative Bardet-Biedl syndrome 1 protein n=1 Tax=Trypanosoma theileri TaxID=67003 RepID=A0A1X0P534_9TRYP|nr:putative Bardet-Biedl syndrome 1 protein [Trypanosoma theileri]ORC92042.1 putative Bardet-Biedl syndrome 1 protein [Trypanosoma theileri]